MTLTLLPPPAATELRRKRVVAPVAAQTRSALVIKLLSRSRGATLAEIVAETGWQPHSARAWLSGERKKQPGRLVRETRRSGDACYRLLSLASTAEPENAEQLPALVADDADDADDGVVA